MARFLSILCFSLFSTLSFSQSHLPELEVLCEQAGCVERELYVDSIQGVRLKGQSVTYNDGPFTAEIKLSYMYVCSVIQCPPQTPLIVGLESDYDEEFDEVIPFGCMADGAGILVIPGGVEKTTEVFACWATYLTALKYSGLDIGPKFNQRYCFDGDDDLIRVKFMTSIINDLKNKLEGIDNPKTSAFIRSASQDLERLESRCRI